VAADLSFVAFEAADLGFMAIVAAVFRFVIVVAAVFRVVAVVAVVAADFCFVAVIVSVEVKAAAAVGLANIDTVVSFAINNLVELAIIDFTLAIFEAEAFVFVIVDAFVYTFSIAS
jgi:hypothetical protein